MTNAGTATAHLAKAIRTGINVDDTVRIDGRGLRYVVDCLYRRDGVDMVSVTATTGNRRVGIHTVSCDVAVSRVSLVRRGNRDLDECNATLRAAGLPTV